VLINTYHWVVLGYLACVLVWAGPPAFAQQAPVSPQPGPAIPGPPPPPQEQLLSPIPAQFDWMRRDVRPNPLLESLLGLEERPPQLFLSGSLAEDYSDNFFLTARDRKDEYRTQLGINTVYRLGREPSFLSLANSLSVNYQARAEQTSVAFANLSLNAGHQVPPLSLALSESFIRSDSGEAAFPDSLRRGRSTFLSNSITPQLRDAFSRVTSGTLAYTNTLVRNEDPARGNTTSHAVTTGLEHQFTPLLSGSVHYTFTTTAATVASDSQAHSATADLGYTVGRSTSARLQTFASVIERSQKGADSHTYGASIGVRQQFTPALSGFGSLGVTVLEVKNRDPRLFPNWQVSLEGTVPGVRDLSVTLASQQDVTDTAGTVDNVGLVLRQSVTLDLRYTVSRLLSISGFVGFTHTELFESVGTFESVQGRRDNLWRAGARASYALTPVLSLSVDYVHQRRDSNLARSSFDENRLTVALSASVPVF
jgi:hypothetical protein